MESEKSALETTTLIQKFQEFFERNYEPDLLEAVRKGQNYFYIDFMKLSKFDPELSELLLEEPEEVLKAAEMSLDGFDLPNRPDTITIRVMHLPKSQKVMIRHLRSKHLGQLIMIEGIVRQKSDVRPQVTSSRFECPSCGNIIPVLQIDTKFIEPSRCGCGRKGKFKMISKELMDVQSLTLEEVPEDLEGGAQPKRMKIFLKNDLVSPLSEVKTNPGKQVIVVGAMKEIPITLRTGGQSTRFDLIIDANSVDTDQMDFSDLKISPEDEEKIKEIAQDPQSYEKIIESLIPSIYGHTHIKEALVLMLMGGVRKERDDGVVTRGDIHVLLIGDPGSGKSMMLKRINVIAPKSRFISGKGASGAGLTATVVKDEFLGGWSLEAGALVLAHKGLCAIDELDKMTKEDTAAMHEALEGQTVTISKASVQATLRCETTVLAAANPKYGRFDSYLTIAEQITLPSTLINRFDLIFPIKDLPDETKDAKMAEFVLNLHQNIFIEEPEFDTVFLRKYFAYAKRHIKPKLTEAAIKEIKKYYLHMRGAGNAEGGKKAIPISARQLEGLIRLSEAVAKVRLSQTVSKNDAMRAVQLLDSCMRLIAFDEETGTFDIDMVATGMKSSQRNKIVLVKEIIAELEEKIGKVIPIEDVTKLAEEREMQSNEVEEVIEKLRRTGDIFEPKRGFISRI